MVKDRRQIAARLQMSSGSVPRVLSRLCQVYESQMRVDSCASRRNRTGYRVRSNKMKQESLDPEPTRTNAVVRMIGELAAMRLLIDALEGEILAAPECQNQRSNSDRLAEPIRAAAEPRGPACPAYSHRDKETAGFAVLRRPLSPRLNQVLQLLHRGLTNLEMARELGVRRSTAGRMRQTLYVRLGVHSASQALDAACRLGLLEAG
jgi:ATP/maltotriose-dependent transcriptional regulator MalT